MGRCLSDSIEFPFLGTSVTHSRTAVWLDGKPAKSYGELVADISRWSQLMPHGKRGLVMAKVSNQHQGLAPMFAALAQGHALILIDAALPRFSQEALIDAYRPSLLVDAGDPAVEAAATNTDFEPFAMDEDLALLLSTSGSTGSPKFVRLTRKAVLHNAKSIANALTIDEDDIGVAHLDMHYSYGWSVIISHLVAGAGLSFSTSRFTEKGFWQSIRDSKATHLPGVPVHYNIMHRLGLARLKIPSVHTMTQAGGRLAESLCTSTHAHMESNGNRFFIMYGQTEASPRMSTLQHDDFPAHGNTVGKALDGGKFSIVDANELPVPHGSSGRVIYHGPNVMLGYANSWLDLCLGDQLQGTLDTGDLGNLDADGFLTIEGRQSRSGKVFGLRVNLDEVEAHLGALGNYLVCPWNDQIALVQVSDQSSALSITDNADEAEEEKILIHLDERFKLPRASWRFFVVNEVPVTPRGKTDYVELARRLM